jgi:hypothetical protein
LGNIVVTYVETGQQMADIMTKSLNGTAWGWKEMELTGRSLLQKNVQYHLVFVTSAVIKVIGRGTVKSAYLWWKE